MAQLDDPAAMAVYGDDDAFVVDDLGTTEEDRDEDDDPYAPAESLRLRIGEDIDWSDVVGAVAVLQRDDSTKGAGANPKSAARRSAQQAAPRSSMSSSAAAQRKAVAVVIGGLPQGKVALARERRCAPSPCRMLGVGGRARVFAAGGEQHASAPSRHHHLDEPGSPKVSCLGAIRPESQRSAGRGVMSRRAWRSWLAAVVTCCFSSRRRAARRSSSSARNEADD